MKNGDVITDFHRLKINIEDPLTQAEFPGMFSIKTQHICRKTGPQREWTGPGKNFTVPSYFVYSGPIVKITGSPPLYGPAEKIQKIFGTCVLESLFTFIRSPHLPKVLAVSAQETIQTKIIFELRKDQSQNLDYYIFDFFNMTFSFGTAIATTKYLAVCIFQNDIILLMNRGVILAIHF